MATYLDNAGVTQILTKIKSLLAKKAEITAIPTKVSQLTNDSKYQNATEVNTKIGTELGKLDYDFKDEQEGNSFAANWFLSGITQTDGKIKAEKADFDKAWGNAFQTSVSRGGEAITETQVDSKIRAAVDKITSFEYKVVSELPPESDGVKGTIYLLRHGGNDNTNSFDEYILVDTYSSGGITYNAHYEKIGTTDIDLTPYAKKTDIPTAVSDLANDLGYETIENVGSRITSAISVLDYSDTAEEGKYVSSVSETNGVIKVTRASLPAVGTADSPISNTTIENIFTQVFG